MSAAVVEEFTAIRKNTLRGFAKVRLASGMILHDIAIHLGSDDKAWASSPSKAMLDREGQALRDETGKIRYSPVIGFATKQQRDRFSDIIVRAVRESHAEALAP